MNDTSYTYNGYRNNGISKATSDQQLYNSPVFKDSTDPKMIRRDISVTDGY